ncbi:hypothetical protein J7L09_01695 [bacterium]|nr:hypothetical protein [bacterium]
MTRSQKIKKLEQEVTRLAHLWYKYISQDHHKDCDCHWYIERRWSYNRKPQWIVWHRGYIFDGAEIKCKNYQEALEKLIKLIKKALQKELEWVEKVLKTPEYWDQAQIKQAKWLKRHCKNLSHI